MTRMAVITPSFAPDFELCTDLSRSILTHSPVSVHHHILIPDRDLRLFGQLGGPRVHIHRASEFLPRSFVAVPSANLWVNARHPYLPVRGWIAQQIIKMAAAAQIEADVALLVDSDIEFVRAFDGSTFRRGGVVNFYRKPHDIDERLPRHMIWHRVARELLGLPAEPAPLHDYICWPCPWDPAMVRALLARVEKVTGKRWADAIGAQRHFSEEILYGVFVDRGGSASSTASSRMYCHHYSGATPLDERGLTAFLGAVQPDDVAVMISAKSRTPLAVRRVALRAAQTPDHGSQVPVEDLP